MKYLVAICCLLVLIGCSNQENLVDGETMTSEIGSDQLIDAFMSYYNKFGGVTLNDVQKAEWLAGLQGRTDDPLLAPYTFAGERCDRDALKDEIAKDKVKLLKSEITIPEREQYALEPSNLDGLTDAELVIASRLVRQLTDTIE